MLDDRALVSRVLAGDMHAFRSLVVKHERLVLHMVGRVVNNSEDREEVCQDVFVRVYKKLGDFNFEAKLSTWIATIAYRYAINHVKKQKMFFSDIEIEGADQVFIESDSPDQLVGDADMDSYVLKLIEQLPAQYKMVLTLYHLEHMSYADISEITKMPEGTVKNYLFRARKLLKEKVMVNLGKEEWL